MSSVASPDATAKVRPPQFDGAFVMLAPHFAALDVFMREQLAAFEPEIRGMAEHCLGSDRDRLAPALVFLSGWRGTSEVSPDLVRVAAVVEFVHLAICVHEGIVDASQVRRYCGTIANETGPTPAILLGDALFAHGLYLPTQFPTNDVAAAVTDATRRVCAGDILQTLRRRTTGFTQAESRRIATLRMGELFSLSCLLGARLAGAEPAYVESACRFGRHFGAAFQLHHDWRQSDDLGVAASLADDVQLELAAAAAELAEWAGRPGARALQGLCVALLEQADTPLPAAAE